MASCSSQQVIPEQKKGRVIYSQARNVINQVMIVCKREAATKVLEVPIAKVNERVANYTGVSLRTICKMNNDVKNNQNEDLDSIKDYHHNPKKAELDSFDREVLRRIVKDFYMVQNKAPTLSNILPVVKANIDYPWKRTILWRTLKEMGFDWRRSQSHQKFIAERPDIVNYRTKYLRQIRHFRKEKRPIFYLDERWIDNNLCFKKCWQADDNRSVTTVNPTNRLIIGHLGNEDGFLQNAELIFRSGTTSGNYHGQMNAENCEKWLKQKVLPKLPPNSVLVMDNAPYHEQLVDKAPTEYDVKDVMIAWLIKKGVPCDKSMRKYTLLDLIQAHKSQEKLFKIDQLLKADGHDLLRLSPHMYNLNPIELVWLKVKKTICENNDTKSITKDLITQALNGVTSDDWQEYVKRIIEIEQFYWECDELIENNIDEFITNLQKDSESEDEEDDENEMT